MLYIQHRVNTAEGARNLGQEFGAEIDLRSSFSRRSEIIVAHDPWSEGPSLEEWLESYTASGPHAAPLILNTKEDGLEESVLTMLRRFGVSSFFFLDTALPTLIRHTIKMRQKHFALRVSQYEPPASTASFVGQVEWIWLDCFDANPMPTNIAEDLSTRFKVCLVSPELQGGGTESIQKFKELMPHAAAVCTKSPEIWRNQFPINGRFQAS